MTQEITPEALAILKKDETCVLTAYQDTGGIWTIGWGHTGREIIEGLVWTQAHADDILSNDISLFVKYVKHYVPVGLSPDQASALAVFAYNAGLVPLKRIGDMLQVGSPSFTVVYSFMRSYVHDRKGQLLQGLVTRREQEISLFKKGTIGEAA